MSRPVKSSWEAVQKQNAVLCCGQSSRSDGAAGNTYEKYTYENGGLIAVSDSQGRKLGVHSIYGCFELPAEKEGGYGVEDYTS